PRAAPPERTGGVPTRRREAAELTTPPEARQGQPRAAAGIPAAPAPAAGSEEDVDVEEAGDQAADAVVVVVEQVAEPLARDQHRDAAQDAEVLAHERAVLDARAQVAADEVVD